MLTVWRLTTARFARSAFSGEGARLYGGRWNNKGVALVYTSATQSLAMLEMLVQDEPLRARYVMIEARIPARVKIERLSVDELPTNWRELKTPDMLRPLGQNGRESKLPRASGAERGNYFRTQLPPQSTAF
jgi:RES domain-containing protein